MEAENISEPVEEKRAISFEALIGKYGSMEPITITLAGGEPLVARRVADAGEVMKMENASKAVVELAKTQVAPEDWKPFLPQDALVIRACYYCSELLVEPAFSMAQALQVAKQCGALILQISEQLMTKAIGLTLQAEADAIQDAKNALSPTA